MFLDILLAVSCLIFILIFLTKSRIGPLFILLAYTQSTGLISSIFVEAGQYISETNRTTSYIGATKWYAIILFLLFSATWTFHSIINKIPFTTQHHSRKRTLERLVTAGIISTLSILYLNIIISGPPLLFPEITRFNFWDQYSKIPFIGSIFGELSIPIIISTSILISTRILHDQNQKTPKKYLLLVAFYILYLFLLEHKFNGFIIALSFLFAPILMARRMQGKALIRIKDIAYALMALIIMLYLSYLFFKNSTGGVIDTVGGNALRGVFYRAFILQGYSWHAFFDLYQMYGTSEIPSNTSLMEYAVNKITANPEFFIQNGINIANIYPGALLLSGGIYKVLLITITTSLILATLSTVAQKLFASGSIIKTTLTIQLLFWVMGAIPACNIEVVYSPKFIALLIILILSTPIKKLLFTPNNTKIRLNSPKPATYN